MASKLQIVAWVDGVVYVTRPIIHIRPRVTLACREWLLSDRSAVYVRGVK